MDLGYDEVCGTPTCSICMEEIVNTLIAHLDDCEHVFHAECMSKWYTRDPNQGDNKRCCPCCRQNIEVWFVSDHKLEHNSKTKNDLREKRLHGFRKVVSQIEILGLMKKRDTLKEMLRKLGLETGELSLPVGNEKEECLTRFAAMESSIWNFLSNPQVSGIRQTAVAISKEQDEIRKKLLHNS